MPYPIILSDCKAALEEIEREYRGHAPGNEDRHAFHAAIVGQLEELGRQGEDTPYLFLWTPGGTRGYHQIITKRSSRRDRKGVPKS